MPTAQVTLTSGFSRRYTGGRREFEIEARTLRDVVGAPVSVKATRAEGLGALGRAEGIACMAVVLMESSS